MLPFHKAQNYRTKAYDTYSWYRTSYQTPNYRTCTIIRGLVRCTMYDTNYSIGILRFFTIILFFMEMRYTFDLKKIPI